MRRLTPTILILVSLLFLTVGVIHTQAQPPTCGDETDLANAIAAANSSPANDVIELDTAIGPWSCEYLLTTPLTIANNGSLTITVSESASIRGRISGGNTTRLFEIDPGANVIFRNVDLSDGYVLDEDGGAILNNGTLTVEDSILSNNEAGSSTPFNSASGSAIQNNGTLTLSNSQVNNNIGGGVISGGIITLQNTSVTNSSNTAVSGNSVTMTNSEIIDSGFIALGVSQNANITDSLISGNGFLSAVVFDPDATFTISNATVENFSLNGIYVSEGATGTITNTQVSSGSGNGIYLAGTADLQNVDISNNSGDGAYIAGDATVSIRDSRLTNNDGFGVETVGFNQAGSVLIETSLLDNNGSNGVHITDNSGDNGTVEIVNSTISQNGGNGVENFGVINLISTTIAENGGYGVNSNPNATTTLTSSIVANNTGINNVIDLNGPIVSGGFNLFGDDTGATFTGVISSNLVGNPLIAPLTDNGGPTLTYEPAVSSLAIDAGLCSTATDQRGETRVLDLLGYPNVIGGNGCDIGAVERQPPAVAADEYTTVYETTLVVEGSEGVLVNDDNTTNGIPILVTNTANGEISLNVEGAFTYIPDNGFVGSDVFTYKIQDGGRESNITTVLITVVEPAAKNDFYSMQAGEILKVDAPGILTNDTQAEGITVNEVSKSLNGILVLASDGSFVYTPRDGFAGVDQFTYNLVSGDISSNNATVLIEVQGDGNETDAIDPPTNLRITGSLYKAPVILTFIWDNPSTVSGPEVFFEWHNLRIEDENEVVIFDEWYPAAQICTAIRCELELDGPQLAIGSFLNGYYRWRVQRWVAGQLSRPSDERGFEVNASRPELLRGDIETDTSTGRLAIMFPDNVNANWYQLFVAKADGTLLHLRWYQKSVEICQNDLCTIYPDVHPEVGNYVLWVQTWGPAGYGIGDFNDDEIGGWAGPINFEIAGDQPGPATPLTPTYLESGRPQFIWKKAQFTTWYQIWTYPEFGSDDLYSNVEWVSTLNAGCSNTMTCTWTPNFFLEDATSYAWYLQGWGPAGFASNGNPSDAFDSWTQAPNYTVNLQVPRVPMPITPTKVVTQPFRLTYKWMLEPEVAWYQFQVEQTDSLPGELTPVEYDNWYAVEDLDCRDDGMCTLEVPELFLPNGGFRWRLRAWNSLLVSLGEDDWSDWVAFTVSRE